MAQTHVYTQAIRVVDLVKRFEDVTAVDGLSFDVEVGEIFGFLGPNGAGKSTTINILSGLLEPTSGKATVLGYDVRSESMQIKERGRTVILTTHYIEEAEALADRVGIIDHGKLIALDTPGALMEEHGAENLEEVFIKLTGRRIREAV